MKVAILDTGVGARREDFISLHVRKSIDFTKSGNYDLEEGLDDNGHGTACAKVIIKNAEKSDIYSLKVLDANRCGNIANLYRALQYLLTQEVDIINMSLAFFDSYYKEKIEITCEKLVKQGKIIVASVGRYENRPYPAVFDSVLGVQGNEFDNVEEFIFDPDAEVQITADDTPVIVEWKRGKIILLGGTSKAAALMSGKIAKWENNIMQRLKIASVIHGEKSDNIDNCLCIRRKSLTESELLKEIIKLIPCDIKHKNGLCYEDMNGKFCDLGKNDYERILNLLIKQFELQLPEYVPLGNIFDSIYTLEEFVERYRL